MNLKLDISARAGHRRRVRHRARHRARVRPRRARVHVCDVEQRARRACHNAPAVPRRTCDVSDGRRRRACSRAAGTLRRPRRAGQQRRHRRHRPRAARRRARRLGAHAGRQPDRPVPVRAARDSAAARERNASIANLSSAAGRFGFPLRTPYAASKWGVIGFTKSLSIELGGVGIRVNAICPGSVAGARIDRVFANKAKLRGVADGRCSTKRSRRHRCAGWYRRTTSRTDRVPRLAAGANISGHAMPSTATSGAGVKCNVDD